jgi:hypothetical protein
MTGGKRYSAFPGRRPIGPIPIEPIPIVVGGSVVGTVCPCGAAGWQAVDANEVSLGVFRDQARAISKLLATAASSAAE